MSITISLSASEALYEEGGALEGSKQADQLELGPFDWVQLTYEGLRVAPDGDHIGFFTEDGVWSIGVERVPINNKWGSFGPAPNGLIFSDVTIHESEDA